MNFADFQTLTFDCYGTLIDWESGILAELRPLVRARGKAHDDDEILATFAAEESPIEVETPGKLYPLVLADTLRAVGRRWGMPVTDKEAAEFGGSVGRWPAFPDSAAALQYLKRRHKLVILSNIDRASFAKSNVKLGVEFDRVLTAEEIGSYKPDIRNFQYAIRTLGEMGVPREKILHVAQSRFHDIGPAKSLGLRTVWVNRRKGRSSGG
ncbi:MAG TPA: haloacid dehalogenase type II, partial [Stellaceae bacterium]|nr:haloacid dehalogenase type II [Stellaceae bacterium]